MKRREFVRRLEQAGCEFHRHGGSHDVYRNPATNWKDLGLDPDEYDER